MTEKHDLVEFDYNEGSWDIRCTCGWYKFSVPAVFEGGRAFLKHLPIGTSEDELATEWEMGRDHGREEGHDEGYDEGWEEGRKDLLKTLEGLKEILDGI